MTLPIGVERIVDWMKKLSESVRRYSLADQPLARGSRASAAQSGPLARFALAERTTAKSKSHATRHTPHGETDETASFAGSRPWLRTTGGGLLMAGWRWIQSRRSAQMRVGRLRVAETVSLGEKRFIAVVEVDGRQFLVGGAATSVSLLAQLEPLSACVFPTIPFNSSEPTPLSLKVDLPAAGSLLCNAPFAEQGGHEDCVVPQQVSGALSEVRNSKINEQNAGPSKSDELKAGRAKVDEASTKKLASRNAGKPRKGRLTAPLNFGDVLRMSDGLRESDVLGHTSKESLA